MNSSFDKTVLPTIDGQFYVLQRPNSLQPVDIIIGCPDSLRHIDVKIACPDSFKSVDTITGCLFT